MLQISVEQLKKFLVDEKIVSKKDFEKTLEESKRSNQPFVDLLIAKGLLSSEYYLELVSKYYNIPLARIAKGDLDQKAISLIPERIAREKKVIAFALEKEGILDVAMADPTDLELIEFLEKYTGKKIRPFLATEKQIESAFAYYGQKMADFYQKVIKENIKKTRYLEGKAEELAKEVSIIDLFNNIVSFAISSNASDIHIEPLEKEVLIRFRVDGILRRVLTLPKEILPPLVARIKILSNLKIDVHQSPQDGRFRFKTIGGVVVDLRVSIMPVYYGEKVVMRLLPAAMKPLSLKELGMYKDHIEITERNIRKPWGIILVCGPTGCGKTTTLYSILNLLNRPEVNIVTIEDPIEYEISYINQSQINPQAGLTFASGLRSILRQDPDIILVGEIRDKETAEIAVQAALTGHLVLSSLHTNDAPGAIFRLIDLGIEPFLIAASLNTVIAQRLVRKICLNCIYSYQVKEFEKQAIKRQLLDELVSEKNISLPKILFRGKGCPFCGFTGYKSRVGIFEIMEMDENLRTLISSGKATLTDVKKYNNQKGVITMFQDGLRKANLSLTTLEEVLRVIKQ